MVSADEGEGRLPWAEFGWWGGKIPAACCGWEAYAPTHTHTHTQQNAEARSMPKAVLALLQAAGSGPTTSPGSDLSQPDADSRQESPGLPAEGPTSGTLRGRQPENRSPWVKFSEMDAVSLGWDKPGSYHPKSQDSGSSLPILSFSSHTLFVGCWGNQGQKVGFLFKK